MNQLLIYLFFIFSGAAGLIYQLVWVRKLVLIFGNTNYATASILTAFMGGLALGSFLIGKYANRVKSPLRFYAGLELGIGISAIAILFLFLPLSDFVYIWAFNAFGDNQVVFNAIRFLLSIGVLIIPTTLMGGTLPIISQYIVRKNDMLGRKIGRLYALNTLGGVAGVVITGYYLIRTFGVNFTLWVAIGINLSIGIFAWLMSRQKEVRDQVSAPKSIKTDKKTPAMTTSQRGVAYSDRTTRMVLYLYGLAGFTALAYEVVWTRALIFFISSTTYSFTTILATFLAGIFLGSLIIIPFVDRIKNLLTWAAVLEVVIALSATATIFFFSNLSEFHVKMLPYFDQGNWSAVSILLFITCSLIIFVPTLCMGMLFPIINRIYVRQVEHVGRGVGYVSMANTIGAIIGSFSGGFILLPLIGLNASIVFLAVVNLLIGVAFFLLARAHHSAPARKVYLPAIAASVAVFVLMNLAFFTPEPFYLDTGSFRNTRMLYHEDTASATLSALETKDRINIWGRNVRYLNVNGHNTAHTSFLDMIIHKTLAHLPMVLHPAPEKALVIGFGFGNSCQSFLQYDCLKQVDCVELVREEQETARFFTHENAGIFEDPRFRFIVNDGRNFVLATQDKYDIISINSVDPKFSPTLYTNDFYQMCREKMTEKGQLVAWLPIYGMTAEEVQSLVKSFVVAFPHSSIWWNNPEHLLLLGFKTGYPFDLAVMTERLADPVVKQSLAAVHLANPYVLLSTFYSGEKMLADWAKTGPIHSDDFPLVEFCRVATNKMEPEVYKRLVNAKESVIPYCVNFEALGEPEQVKQILQAYEKQAEIIYGNLFTCQILGR
ncbi:fused MFS/spermidine synthase, partial [bacterium]|nr:fused MFS/spermidine synthase [bacterium]